MNEAVTLRNSSTCFIDYYKSVKNSKTHKIPMYAITVPVILLYHLPIQLKDLQPSIWNTMQYGIRGSAFVQNIIFGTWPAASCLWMHHTGDDVQYKSVCDIAFIQLCKLYFSLVDSNKKNDLFVQLIIHVPPLTHNSLCVNAKLLQESHWWF